MERPLSVFQLFVHLSLTTTPATVLGIDFGSVGIVGRHLDIENGTDLPRNTIIEWP
ncbi:hypothetical protein [Halocatena marina]|uniref:Uncharacterized protein n=1 Tax=Halocatena marina TaxID=2934937 RepID=A0ABD5YMX9_9EURY|nr:hypothetical protein [Halocatena marina]